MTNKIIARNLTARAAYDVPGNPPSTRLESGVSNCYPGLEYDHRNLDRRFFPGLIFEFVSQDDAVAPEAARRGAFLRGVDIADPALTPPAGIEDTDPKLGDRLGGDLGNVLSASPARWYLSAIAQRETSIALTGADGMPLDGLVVWRLVRSLRPGPVRIELRRRDTADAPVVSLVGWRRRYADASSGVISRGYQAGELTQSLCSPWMHDFRDCGCTYWASNHPDIVLGEVPLDERALPSGAAPDVRLGDTQVDWLRADRDWSATAAVGPQGEYATQMSHFEINQRWQDLSIVLEGREIGDFYIPRSREADNAKPYATPLELRNELVALAGLEHLVALLYLYARYSVIAPEEAKAIAAAQDLPLLVEDVAFTRHVLLDVALGEMQHLRAVNQILWGLFEARVVPGWEVFEPSVTNPALVIPGTGGRADTPAALAPLTTQTVKLFVAIEEPSGSIDGRYSRATATLHGAAYPPHLHELASTIVRDGERHFLQFRDMQSVLAAYQPSIYLRPVELGSATEPAVKAALDVYGAICGDLFVGYQRGNPSNLALLAEARRRMFVLDESAEALAKTNVGIPYLSLFSR